MNTNYENNTEYLVNDEPCFEKELDYLDSEEEVTAVNFFGATFHHE